MRVSERRMVSGFGEVARAGWLRKAFVLTGLVGAGVALGGAGCGSSDCAFDATCGTPSDAGSDADVTWPTGCTPGAEPSVDRECLSESIGYFVSSQGNDTVGDGKQGTPFRTVAKALESFSRQKHRIFICDGEYSGNLNIDAAHTGLEIYGGFACGNWAYTGERSKIKAADPNAPAAQWQGATAGKIRDVEISSGDATKDGASSIAVFTSGSTLDFARVKLIAGDGRKGADGVLVPFDFVNPSTLNGASGVPLATGEGKSSTCQSGTPKSTGGSGGGINGNGTKGIPDLGQGAGGAGGGTCALGGNGAAGGPGGPGEKVQIVGVLTAAGWAGASGKDGSHGSPGQGGGGGGGGAGGGGGGGGAGGCGGTGGPGGQAGGSSIGLASFDSRLTVADSELTTKSGQDAGAGVDGQAGQGAGGFGGDRGAGNACPGGAGGAGGKGGAGGGGAGGSTIGIVFSGPAPKLDAQTQQRITNTGDAGDPGVGALSTNGGIKGVKQPIYQLQ